MSATCRIPGCTGHNHLDDLCNSVTRVDGPGIPLIAEVEAWEGSTPELIVWETDDIRNLFRTRDQAVARAFADKLRTLAAAVDKGAALLATPPDSVATPDPSVDYAARFAALDYGVLFDLEDGDCDNVTRYVESLLIVLAEWRPRVVALLADAPEWAVPEAAQYRAALNRTREALTQWEFRWQGGPDLPETFDLPEPVVSVTSSTTPKGHVQTVTPLARIESAGRRDLILREVAA